MTDMNGLRRSRSATPEPPTTVAGPTRVGASLSALTRRLRPGDVAIISVMDLDRRSAAALAAAAPAAVLNAREFLSGRFPAGGAAVLSQAGVPLVEGLGAGILDVKDGTVVELDGGEVTAAGVSIASGTRLTEQSIEASMSAASDGMAVQLASFTANAMDHVDREADLLLDGKGLPDVDVDMEGRHVLIVTGGYRHAEQLQSLRRYIRERRPLVIAVGDGGDALAKARLKPAVIVGNVEHVSERALRAARHVMVHDPSGAEAGQTRVEALGLSHSTCESGLASEDLALLLAHTRGAAVIVTVGLEARLVDFLERDRSEVAGTFLARLQAGGSVVHAEALARIYRARYSTVTLVVMMLSALAALGVALWVTPGGRPWLENVAQTVMSWLGVA